MNSQIEIQFTGTYKLDEGATVVDPLVIAVAATDDFVSSVAVACLFQAPTYSYYRDIGSFNYTTTWGNLQVEAYINDYMNAHKI
jgi:hypothetical protein